MSSKPINNPDVKGSERGKYSASPPRTVPTVGEKIMVTRLGGPPGREVVWAANYDAERTVGKKQPKISQSSLSKAIAPIMAKQREQEAEITALKNALARINPVQEAEENTYCVPQSLTELKPRRLPPAGKTAMEMIQGQWPGEETTEELLAKLKALD